MTTINITTINCVRCGLPNGEADRRPGEPCFHCRTAPRAKDDIRHLGTIIDESVGEGEERSFFKFWRRGSKPRSTRIAG